MQWSWSLIRLMRLPASLGFILIAYRMRRKKYQSIFIPIKKNSYILLDSSKSKDLVLYLYWDILQTAEKIVTVQAVQIITSVNLKITKISSTQLQRLWLTDFLSCPSEWKEMLSILSGTVLPDLLEEMVEELEEEDLLEVERMSENWSQLLVARDFALR